MALDIDWGAKAQYDRQLNEHNRLVREQRKQDRIDTVNRRRTEAQAAADALRAKRESLPTLNTAQPVTGDVELDVLVRAYERTVDALEAAIAEAGEDA